MTIATQPALTLPDHTQLPESDGTFVKNFQEHPQSLLLTGSICPTLDALHPDGRYAIGQDCGIYWRLIDPPERGAEAPDWFYVPNVPPLLNGERRRSYVLWKEIIAPLIVIEFVSGDGNEEREQTSPFAGDESKAGKFWVCDQAIRVLFYGIYEIEKASVELYELIGNHYQRCEPNERGHYPVPPLGVELGIWQGEYMNQALPWLRWWDDAGKLLLTGEERAELEKQRAEQEKQRAELENSVPSGWLLSCVNWGLTQKWFRLLASQICPPRYYRLVLFRLLHMYNFGRDIRKNAEISEGEPELCWDCQACAQAARISEPESLIRGSRASPIDCQ